MAFNGSGSYSLPGAAINNGDTVSATEHNTFRNDVASTFNNVLARDGQTPVTANLPLGGHKLTGLGAATASGDALSQGAAASVTTLTASGAITGASIVGPLTGNASTATTLETARTIGGVSFNGSANINLPGVNTAGNQDTSGTATNATNATNVGVTASAAAADYYPTFVTATTGNLPNLVDANLTYNPSTNTLTAPNITTGTTASTAGTIGVGTAPNTAVAIYDNRDKNAATSYGVISSGQVNSSVTAAVQNYYSEFSTQAATFTLTNFYHFFANQGTIGAGSSVTNQYGFIARSTLTGATNNYGFAGAIAAGANRWNFYASGTANNAFAGNVRIGSVVAPTVALDVTGAITASGTVTAPTFAGNATTATTATALSSALPKFDVYLSANQSVASTVLTRVAFNTERFDIGGIFDSVTNYRCTPTVAGYYKFNWLVKLQSSTTNAYTVIYKNGTAYKEGLAYSGGAITAFSSSGEALVYMNGTTDYVELWGQVTSATPAFAGTSIVSYFSGSYVSD